MNNKKTLVLTIVFAVILIVSIVMSITSLTLLQKTNDKLEKLEQNNDTTLKAQVTELLTQITDLESKLGLANGTIATLTTQINDLKDKANVSETTIAELQSQLSKSETDINNLKANISSLESEIKDMAAKNEVTDSVIADLTQKLEVANYKLEAATINSEMIALSYSVDTLFTKKDDQLVPAKFTEEINAVNTLAQTLNTRISALTVPNGDNLADIKESVIARYNKINTSYTTNLEQFATKTTENGAGIKIVPNTLNMYVIPAFANADPVSINAQRLNANAIDTTVNEATCLTMPYYGIYNVTLSAGNATETIQDLSIYADKYNIVALNGTLSLTMFTLDLWNVNDVPTYVFLERVNSWNWEQLPENVYAYGEISQTEFHNNRTRMQAYIGELYKSNPNAHFTLYTNDNYTENSLWMYQHNIPEANFDINLMSDGIASYNFFNTHLGKGGVFNQDVYDEMKAEWNTAKARAREGKSLAECVAGLKYVNANDPFSTLRYYTYVVANEESNIKWQLARPALLNGYNNNSLPSKASIISVNMGNQLKAITANNLENELKTLFKFDQDAFAAGIASGKKIMMLLGTYPNEYDVYTKFLMFYCGDEYYIYYKGHPNEQTNSSLIDKYEAMGVDASINMSIPAELLIFYNPTISASGYQSSTFQNIESDIKVLFASKAAIHNNSATPYRAEVYISIVANTGNKIVKVEYEANDEVKYWSMDTNDYCENPNA